VELDGKPQEAARTAAFAPGVARAIQAHESPITDVHHSPDGRWIVTSSGRPGLGGPPTPDNSIALWDFETGQLVQRLVGHEDTPTHIEFGPDGRSLLSSSIDGNFILWDIESGQEIRRFHGRLPLAWDVRYLKADLPGSDGPAALATSVRINEEIPITFDPLATAELELALWDVETGTVVHRFEPDREGQFIKRSALGDERRILITAQNERIGTDRNAPYNGNDTFIVWDTATGQILQRLEVDAPGFWTDDITISPDGNLSLISMESRSAGALLRWNLDTNELIRQDFDRGVSVHQFSPDGNIAFIDNNLGIQQIDPRSGEILRGLGENADYLIFSEDGQRMLSFRPMILWDPVTGEKLARFATSDEPTVGTLMPDGNTAITGHPDGLLRFWDIRSGAGAQTAAVYQVMEKHGDQVTSALFTPDGRTVLSAGGILAPGRREAGDNSLILWDVDSSEVVRRFEGHEGLVWSLAFSPNGRLAASGSQDHSVILSDVQSGEQVYRWKDLGGTVTSLAFTPDGSALLAGIGSPWVDSELGGLVLLDVETGSVLRRFGQDERTDLPRIAGLAISPDGDTVLTGAFKGQVILWDMDTGLELRRFTEEFVEEPGVAVEGLAFTPDGRAFLTGSFVGSVILWDFETGEIIRRFPTDPDSFAHLVDISPDGTAAIAAFELSGGTGESTRAVILWDLETGEELQRFEGHTEWVRGTTFSPDGKLVVSASGDGTARI
jgi:WD40 repeat protein